METIINQNVSTNTSSCTKKCYKSPELTIYGDIAEITLKVQGLQDHNQSGGNANDQGWPTDDPRYES